VDLNDKARSVFTIEKLPTSTYNYTALGTTWLPAVSPVRNHE
jgi:hypothetical protein